MLALTETLRHANRYGLRYIFVHDKYYEPLLTFAGWRQIDSFNYGETTVWTTIGVPPATKIPSPLKPPRWQGIMWGTVPFGVSLVTLLLAFVFAKEKDNVDSDAERRLEEDDSAGTGELVAIRRERSYAPDIASSEYPQQSDPRRPATGTGNP
jgi:hypothetical protein